MFYQKKLYHLLSCLIFLCTLIHFSAQQSINVKEKPAINFYGTLSDQSNNVYEVENITISGMYRQIPFYKEPIRKNLNPETNITRFDLDEIYQIAVPYKGDLPQFYTYKNRDYIVVEITQNDSKKTKSLYIIETKKKIYCQQVTDNGPLEKELSFEAVNKIIIKGHSEHREKKQKHKSIE